MIRMTLFPRVVLDAALRWWLDERIEAVPVLRGRGQHGRRGVGVRTGSVLGVLPESQLLRRRDGRLLDRREGCRAWNARWERTCHDSYDGREFGCSECGAVAHLLIRDEAGEWQRAMPDRCPACGAKVVER